MTRTDDDPTADILKEIYRRSALIKLCDEQFRAMLSSGKLTIAYYSPRGQEIVASAMAVTLSAGDYVLSTYRGLHDHLAIGVPLKELCAEFAGKATGSCKGKGGPMHMTHPPSGLMVTTGIVGAGIPIANGFGWASALRGDGRITVCNFGDGAANIGAFHEGLNLASLWKLPVIFLCTNNRYAECTRFEDGTTVKSVAERAAAYSMPGISVDGNDAIAMWRAARDAVNRARSGAGPTLIEARSFRLMGHYFGDPGAYIPKDEYAQALQADPVPRLRQLLIDRAIASESELALLEREISSHIEAAMSFAMLSPWPDVSELRRDVYKEEVMQ